MAEPQIRRFGVGDSLAELTELLNDAYRIHLEKGLRYVATWQDESVTSSRMTGAECWIAVEEGRIVGTITLRPPERAGGHPFYDRPDVAVFNQLAVTPEHQHHGLGSRLLERVEMRAHELGAAEIACDTAQSASELIQWYKRHGYRIVGTANWETTNYRSYLLSKKLEPTTPPTASSRSQTSR